jgi:hypothetical protein
VPGVAASPAGAIRRLGKRYWVAIPGEVAAGRGAGTRRLHDTALTSLQPVLTDWGNLAVSTPDQLAATVKNRLNRIRYRLELIDGFLAQTGSAFSPNHRRDHQTLAFQPL